MRSASLGVKALIYTLVAVLFAVVLLGLLRGNRPGGRTYTAIFTDASNMHPDSEVRAAGVVVGRVAAVAVRPDNLIRVDFEVRPDIPVTRGTGAQIKYADLVGGRYLELVPGRGGAAPLPPGGTIPVSRTRPALDLDELFNGFMPLFEGLQPQQINQLATSLIKVLQGEGGSIGQLLGQVGSLTGALADRDTVIDELIDNLNGVLGTVDDHSGQLNDLVVQLTELVRGLSKDRARIGRSVTGINNLTGSVSDLLYDARPDLQGAVHQLDRVSRVLNADHDLLDYDLRRAPGYYAILGRLGAYSSAFQFYLCGVQLSIVDPVTGTRATAPFYPGPKKLVKRCRF